MSTFSSPFQVQVASIMEAITKTAVAEITKLLDAGSADLRLEISRSQRENEELKTKLLLMEGELRAVRGYEEETPDNSLNLSFEVKVCDDFSEAHGSKFAGEGSVSPTESVINEGLSAHLTRDDQNVPVEKAVTPDVFDVKHESIDGEQDWIGEGDLCKEEEVHMQPCPAGDPQKELQAEIKQEPEEQPITPMPPVVESSDLGLLIQGVYSEAISSGIALQQNRTCEGDSEHGDSWLADDFSPSHYRTSQRPCTEEDEGPASQLEQEQNGRPLRVADDISAEMAFPLGSTGESGGSAPCEASSDTSAEAKSPCRIEGQEGEFICTRCGKTLLDALELKMHEEQHNAGPCEASADTSAEAKKTFLNALKLKAHEEQKRFSSLESSKDFTSSRILEKHEQVHSRVKPLTRSVFNKSFSQSHVLQEQKSTAIGERPYVCAECGKGFSLKKRLHVHQRIHTGEKPFTCKHCGKCFTQKGNLKSHQRVHRLEKPYRCNECGKSFAKPSFLETHQRIHTGEKPFSCKHCGKCFTQKGNITRHQRVHTQEKPYHCNECGKSFAQLVHLQTHQRVHTGGERNAGVHC